MDNNVDNNEREKDSNKGFWATMPGILTKLTAVCGALTALVATLYQTGVIGGRTPSLPTFALPTGTAPQAPTAPSTPAVPEPPVAPIPSPSVPTPAISPTQTSANNLVVEDNNLRFELRSCNRSGGALICDVLVTNTGKEDVFVIFNASYSSGIGNTRAIDTDGEQYEARNVKLGSNTNQAFIRTILIQGIPTKVRISFETSDKINGLNVLVFGYGLGETYAAKQHNVQFRNVQVSN